MWSFGIILLEILLGQPIWINEKINVQTTGQKIESVQKRGEVVAYTPETTKNLISDIAYFISYKLNTFYIFWTIVYY